MFRRALITLFLPLLGGWLAFSAHAQTVTKVIDRFDTNSYPGGSITNTWRNWFGSAFQSTALDATNDAGGNPVSGALKISATYFGGTGTNQFTVYNGFNVFSPPLNAVQFTNFSCDLRFSSNSATYSSGGKNYFPRVSFGMETPGFGQYYWGNVDVVSTNTNWVHISLALNVANNANLAAIGDVVFNCYNTTITGPVTLWVDNVQFIGMQTVSGAAKIDYNDTHQRIDGFGASSAWDSTWNTQQADIFFSTNTGAGLSLLRTRIAPDGSTVESGIAQMAQARGARVWSTPWSPPAIYKDTNSVNGGNFVSSVANMQGYASQLAKNVALMKNTYGVSLYALSVQNEPNYSTTYESCLWSSQQLHDFLPYLSAALTSSNVAATKIIIAEDANWKWDLATASMGDLTTSNLVGIIAAHNYGTSPAAVTQFGAPCPKPIWETEHYFGNGDDITNGLALAQEIHSFLTVAEVSAYHYWWLKTYGGNGSLSGDNTVAPAKRLYTMGNYSRFVRPNFYRVGLTNITTALVSAFKDSDSTNFVIVAANPTAYPVAQKFTLTNFPAITRLAPWATTATVSLADLGVANVTNGIFNYLLPAWSVVSFSSVFTSYPTNLSFSRNGTNLTLTWPQTHLGWTLQTQTNALATGLGLNWVDVLNSDATNKVVVPLNAVTGSGFYRLRR